MTQFSTALAETNELTSALEGLTTEAAAVGTITGAAVGAMAILAMVWMVFRI